MLSDELRGALATVRYEICRGTCTPDLWRLYCERMDELANRLEAWERAAGPGPLSRGEVATGGNVVALHPGDAA